MIDTSCIVDGGDLIVSTSLASSSFMIFHTVVHVATHMRNALEMTVQDLSCSLSMGKPMKEYILSQTHSSLLTDLGAWPS